MLLWYACFCQFQWSNVGSVEKKQTEITTQRSSAETNGQLLDDGLFKTKNEGCWQQEINSDYLYSLKCFFFFSWVILISVLCISIFKGLYIEFYSLFLPLIFLWSTHAQAKKAWYLLENVSYLAGISENFSHWIQMITISGQCKRKIWMTFLFQDIWQDEVKATNFSRNLYTFTTENFSQCHTLCV